MSRECQLQASSRCLTLRLEDSEIIRSVVRLSPRNFLAMLCLLHLQPPGTLTAQAKLAHICHPWKQRHRLTIKSLAMAFGATFWIQTIAGRVSGYGKKVLQVEKGKKLKHICRVGAMRDFLSTLSPFYSVRCCLHLGGVFPPLLTLSGNALTHTRRCVS